jgi:hypothetical protein
VCGGGGAVWANNVLQYARNQEVAKFLEFSKYVLNTGMADALGSNNDKISAITFLVFLGLFKFCLFQDSYTKDLLRHDYVSSMTERNGVCTRRCIFMNSVQNTLEGAKYIENCACDNR